MYTITTLALPLLVFPSVCLKKDLAILRSKASSFCSKALEEVLTVSTSADLVTSWPGRGALEHDPMPTPTVRMSVASAS